MTKNTWNALRTLLMTTKDLPTWLGDQGQLPFDKVSKLPRLGAEPQGTISRPHVTEEAINADYLDFLREQIKLEPRDREWTRVLEVRLSALHPLVGRKVLMASFYHKPDSATLYINPDSGQLLLAEVL